MTERSINESALADVLNLPEPATHENSFDPDAPVIDKSLFYNLATLIVVLFCVIPVILGTLKIGIDATLALPGKIEEWQDAKAVRQAHEKNLAIMDEIEAEDGIPFPAPLRKTPETAGLNEQELNALVTDLEAMTEQEIFEARSASLLSPRILSQMDDATKKQAETALKAQHQKIIKLLGIQDSVRTRNPAWVFEQMALERYSPEKFQAQIKPAKGQTEPRIQ